MKKVLGRGLSALVPETYEGNRDMRNTSHETSIQEIAIKKITTNPLQPRNHYSEAKLQELAQSIREKGIIQPIVVAKREGGMYEIVCGERRFRAAQKADIHTIPVVVKDIADSDTLEIALIENIQREDLNPIEEARAYSRLQHDNGYTHEQIATRVGKDRVTITNAIRLLKLPFDILDLVLQKEITEGHARALLAIEDEEHQRIMARKITQEALSVRQTEKLIREKAYKKRRAKQVRKLDAEIVNLENLIQQKIGTKVRIFAGKKNKGKLEIRYESLEDLDRILDLMGVYRG